MFLLKELWMYTINELLKYLSCFNYSVNVVHFRLQWDYYIRGHNSNITWEWRKTTRQYNQALLWCLDLLYGIRGRGHWFLEKGTYKIFVVRWYYWNKAIQVWLKYVYVFKSERSTYVLFLYCRSLKSNGRTRGWERLALCSYLIILSLLIWCGFCQHLIRLAIYIILD